MAKFLIAIHLLMDSYNHFSVIIYIITIYFISANRKHPSILNMK